MTVLKNKNLSLDIALTSRCPLRCRYCSVEKTPIRELSAREWARIVASFARLRQIELVSLEGGEPFLRQDLPMILAAALDCAQSVKIVTSGVIPFQTLPHDLIQHPRVSLELSLDGPREVQDFLRDGSWERALNFLQAGLERGGQMRLRSVISQHNIFIFESWLTGLDVMLEPYGQKVGISFDTIIAPETLTQEGGGLPRLGLRYYPTRGLLPAPAEMRKLFQNLKSLSFRNLVLQQTEPLRGCGAARRGVISFDPSGIFSFCCEAPRGMGSMAIFSAEQCLALLDAQILVRPCPDCFYLQANVCHGCFTGQKCGMVRYWKAIDCRALHHFMFQDYPRAVRADPGPASANWSNPLHQ
ncbi:MAG: radical SAM protein [Deltaproteobacteria bacterium]|nr:radical SAM protein [Deltaproteobacteria bacterium]